VEYMQQQQQRQIQMTNMGAPQHMNYPQAAVAYIQPTHQQYAQASYVVQPVQPRPVGLDTTGDGLVDSVGYDLNGDGRIDATQSLRPAAPAAPAYSASPAYSSAPPSYNP
jgi:hypothetical protein